MHWHITVIVKKITSIVVGIFVILVMSISHKKQCSLLLKVPLSVTKLRGQAAVASSAVDGSTCVAVEVKDFAGC